MKKNQKWNTSRARKNREIEWAKKRFANGIPDEELGEKRGDSQRDEWNIKDSSKIGNQKRQPWGGVKPHPSRTREGRGARGRGVQASALTVNYNVLLRNQGERNNFINRGREYSEA